MNTPRLVADIYPGPNGSSLGNFRAVGSTLYFTAFDGRTGFELWKSNGTSAGTRLVKDIMPGLSSSFPGYLTPRGNTLFFSPNGAPRTGGELWVSNGSSAGTRIVKDMVPGLFGSGATPLAALGGRLLFFAQSQNRLRQNSRGLWVTSGTSAGTRLVKNNVLVDSGLTRNADAAELNKNIFFSGQTALTIRNSGLELWKSNGTGAGTRLVRDIRPGSLSSKPRNFTRVGNTLFFTADDGRHGRELWKSDGTPAGTTLVKDILTGVYSSEPQELTAVGNTLFFTAANDLWKSDGTPEGTTLVGNIATGSFGGTTYRIPSYAKGLAAMGNTLFFSASGGINGNSVGLWKTNGTADSTVFVSDLVYSPKLAAVGRTLFFPRQANDGKGGELWALDVTL